MNCRSCNTRMPAGSGACPNCGHVERNSGFIDRPGDSASRISTGANKLAPSSLSPASDSGAASYELDEEVELPLESAVGKAEPPARKKQARKAAAARPAKVRKPAPEPPAGESLVLDTARIRQLIREQPELIEAGLSAHTDDAGAEIGLDFETEVGCIDLLGEGVDGALVVVMIAEPGGGAGVVPEVLLRMGWVRKHLVKSPQAVRAIVLLEEVDEELGYAAAAVADTVEFRTCRMAISFDPVEV